jgi:hypothetical protein
MRTLGSTALAVLVFDVSCMFLMNVERGVNCQFLKNLIQLYIYLFCLPVDSVRSTAVYS